MRVLVVDDEPDVAQSLARGLKEAGIPADPALDLDQAQRRIDAGPPYDLVILDVMLDTDDAGLRYCRTLRAEGDGPKVLMLSARDDLRDRLAGFDAGADDYLVKPFYFEELLARVRALDRRGTVSPASPSITIANVLLDERLRRVAVEDVAIQLTKKEFDLLNLLMRNSDRVLTDAQILESVWDDTPASSDALVGVYVSRLRKKLSAHGARVAITNHRGVGYLLTIE